MHKRTVLLKFAALFILLNYGCALIDTDAPYYNRIETWHQLRIDSLKGKAGFLNLAGLYWLEKGETSFGSDSSNTLDFTSVAAPFMGSFLRNDSAVYLIPQAPIIINEEEVVDTLLVFNTETATTMKYKSLYWFVIKRGDKIGVRLRDYKHPLLQSFDSIDYFKTDPSWRVEAQWLVYKDTKLVPFANVLGMIIEYPVLGAFRFKVNGEQYKLEPLGKPDPNGYFVMFYDKTSGISTYGSGRYIYVEEPDENGSTFIDFNKAFNPPCAFTEFATCLFPHKENRLPIFVNAGEKF